MTGWKQGSSSVAAVANNYFVKWRSDLLLVCNQLQVLDTVSTNKIYESPISPIKTAPLIGFIFKGHGLLIVWVSGTTGNGTLFCEGAFDAGTRDGHFVSIDNDSQNSRP